MGAAGWRLSQAPSTCLVGQPRQSNWATPSDDSEGLGPVDTALYGADTLALCTLPHPQHGHTPLTPPNQWWRAGSGPGQAPQGPGTAALPWKQDRLQPTLPTRRPGVAHTQVP